MPPGDSAAGQVYATTEERLVNTLNTAGKGRNPQVFGPGTQAL
jgi:hypothetical protein